MEMQCWCLERELVDKAMVERVKRVQEWRVEVVLQGVNDDNGDGSER